MHGPLSFKFLRDRGADPGMTGGDSAQDDLRQIEVRYQMLLENTRDIVARYDRRFHCLHINPPIEGFLGLKPEQLIGKTLSEIAFTQKQLPERIIREHVAAREAAIDRVFRTRKSIETEFEFVGLSGRAIFEWRVVPELDDAGQVVSVLSISRDVSQQRAMEEELRAAARTDALTGLPNRALFCERLQQAVLHWRRLKDYRFAVLFLDFDRFRTINDTLGHEMGDMLLRAIAQRLRGVVGGGDSPGRPVRQHACARIGGDEFVVLLDEIAGPDEATGFADRLLQVLAQPYHMGAHTVYSTVSIGIVTSNLGAGSAGELLCDADTAMYEAKLAGKGRYVVFDLPMRQRLQRRLALENDLRHAADAGQLFLMYQPIISLQSGQIESFEALVRWQHPEHGLIGPSEFIPIAEDNNLIVPIGAWVLREACTEFAKWRQSMGAAAPRHISVNLSRNQLMSPDVAGTIGQVLEQTGMAPERLHLEITESAVMKDAPAAARSLHAIKDLGVKADMDDFGTGYSSMAYVHQFPFDVLKIDRSFIANLGRGREFVALVHAVIQLAHNLNITVVAEGIETLEQVQVLQTLESEYGQGYFFSRALAAGDVLEFMAHNGVLARWAA